MAKKSDILNVFPNYVQLFNQLDREYKLIPGWRMFKQLKILRCMGRVNKGYARWFDKWLKVHEITEPEILGRILGMDLYVDLSNVRNPEDKIELARKIIAGAAQGPKHGK